MVTTQRAPVLVLCDDQWHPAATVRAGLEPLSAMFAFDFIEDARDWSAERMKAYPVALLSKSNNVSSRDHAPWVDDQVATAFVEYVRSGRGLVAIHSGTAGYQEQHILRGLLGGVFDRHPEQCKVGVVPNGEHRLGADAVAFEEKDEHYMMLLDDPAVDVFLTTHSEHGEQPGGWTRAVGAGRVCVLTPGHNLAVWLQPGYQTLIRNALTWAREPAPSTRKIAPGNR